MVFVYGIVGIVGVAGLALFGGGIAVLAGLALQHRMDQIDPHRCPDIKPASAPPPPPPPAP